MRKQKKLLLATFLFCTLMPPLPAFAAGEPTEMELDSIDYVTDNGLMPLFLDGSFRPDQPVSRIEFLLVVLNDVYSRENYPDCFARIASEQPPRFTHLFVDVPVTVSYAEHLCVGMHVGLVNGERSGTFAPGRTITFAEAAKWITKAYGIAPGSAFHSPRLPWYEPYRHALAKANSVPPSIMRPDQLMTRGEAAQILYGLRGQKPASGMIYKNEGAKPMKSLIIKIIENEKSPDQSAKVDLPSQAKLKLRYDQYENDNRGDRDFIRPSKRSIHEKGQANYRTNDKQRLLPRPRGLEQPGNGSGSNLSASAGIKGHYATRLFYQ